MARWARPRFGIVLIEAGSRLLPGFPEEISEATRLRLQALSISVIVNGRVQSASEEGFVLASGELIPAGLRVWAAGVKAPAFLAQLGLETTQGNQLKVNGQLQTSDPHVYAVGDCASYTLPGASVPLPPTAQVAHQQARYLVETLPRLLKEPGFRPEGFAYRDFGALVSLAHYDAYGSLGKFGLFNGGVIRGRMAMLSHIMLYRSHQARIYGFWRGGLLWLIDLMNCAPAPVDPAGLSGRARHQSSPSMGSQLSTRSIRRLSCHRAAGLVVVVSGSGRRAAFRGPAQAALCIDLHVVGGGRQALVKQCGSSAKPSRGC